MAVIARLQLTALDCPDPDALAAFYSALTGWPVAWRDHSWVQLDSGAGPTLAFQRADDFAPPTWPDPERPQQLHLDFEVDDLEVGESAVVQLGARKTATQPKPDRFRVFLDPAGHPFCLVRSSR